MAAAGASAAPDASDSVLYIVRHGDRFDRETGGWDGKVGITFAATVPLALTPLPVRRRACFAWLLLRATFSSIALRASGALGGCVR